MTCRFPVYEILVIRSFREPKGRRSGARNSRKSFAASKKLRFGNIQITRAASLRDLALPGNNLDRLGRDRKAQYSIRINDQFRVCFAWQDGDALNVEIIDYH